MNTNTLKKLTFTLVLGMLVTAWGCENVGLMKRENIARNSRYSDRRDDDRRDRYDRDSRRDRIYGTVQDVDDRRREIRVRDNDGRTAVIRYDSDTRVSDGSRDIRPDSLRRGDMVSIRLERDSGGERYAESIRVEERRSSSEWR